MANVDYTSMMWYKDGSTVKNGLPLAVSNFNKRPYMPVIKTGTKFVFPPRADYVVKADNYRTQTKSFTDRTNGTFGHTIPFGNDSTLSYASTVQNWTAYYVNPGRVNPNNADDFFASTVIMNNGYQQITCSDTGKENINGTAPRMISCNWGYNQSFGEYKDKGSNIIVGLDGTCFGTNDASSPVSSTSKCIRGPWGLYLNWSTSLTNNLNNTTAADIRFDTLFGIPKAKTLDAAIGKFVGGLKSSFYENGYSYWSSGQMPSRTYMQKDVKTFSNFGYRKLYSDDTYTYYHASAIYNNANCNNLDFFTPMQISAKATDGSTITPVYCDNMISMYAKSKICTTCNGSLVQGTEEGDPKYYVIAGLFASKTDALNALAKMHGSNDPVVVFYRTLRSGEFINIHALIGIYQDGWKIGTSSFYKKYFSSQANYDEAKGDSMELTLSVKSRTHYWAHEKDGIITDLHIGDLGSASLIDPNEPPVHLQEELSYRTDKPTVATFMNGLELSSMITFTLGSVGADGKVNVTIKMWQRINTGHGYTVVSYDITSQLANGFGDYFNIEYTKAQITKGCRTCNLTGWISR